MKYEHCYALIAAVSIYEKKEEALPAGIKDLRLMKDALTKGLLFPEENIRTLGETGYVSLREYVRALQEFAALLSEEDLLVVYFSGHGNGAELAFSDVSIGLESLVGYLRKMNTRNRILILDACRSGAARAGGRPEMKAEDIIGELTGRGTAIMASASRDERSWMSSGRPGCDMADASGGSLFTEAVCMAMRSRLGAEKGRKTVFGLMEYTRSLIDIWNRIHPEHTQHPVFSSDMIGTVTFETERPPVYEPAAVELELEKARLSEVRSLSTGTVRRAAAFFICNENAYDAAGHLTPETVAAVTEEAAAVLRKCSVYKDAREEARFRGVPARAVWCYFGRDRDDMREGTYEAYGLWTADDEIREMLCRSRGSYVGGIYVWMNPSYKMVRKMREAEVDRDACIRELRELLSVMVSNAETFIEGFHRWENREVGLEELRASMKNAVRDALRAYVRLSDIPDVDEESREWCRAVMEVADWTMDLSIPLEEGSGYGEDAVRWLLRVGAERYYEVVEKV